jgi:hypothetical protein
MRRRALRYGPAALTALVALSALACLGSWRGAAAAQPARVNVRTPAPTPTATPAPLNLSAADECFYLASLSQAAARATGAVALVAPQERRRQAYLAASVARMLAEEAARTENGAELAKVLSDLADALEAYDLPRITAASAANAALRAEYVSCAALDNPP